MAGTVIVVGSINADITIGVPTIPRPGETVLGDDAVRAWGGKGANQAVAAADAGAAVWMIGAVGDDDLGRGARDALHAAGVHTEFVGTVDRPTGLAAIVVDPSGENAIAVAPGANDLVEIPDGLGVLDVPNDVVVLISLEISDTTVAGATRLATDRGWPIVVNPAPARALPDSLLDAAPILVPNEHEARTLTGETDVDEAAAQLHRRTGAPVIVTLGAVGALVADDQGVRTFAAPQVTVVDTTGAGDAFCGALAATIAAGRPLAIAVEAGVAAGTVAVTRPGARR